MVRQILALALLAAVASATYTWDSCGTKLDRLMTKKLTVDGKMAAGQKVTVTAVGATNLHVPLETGAWQVRVYETGVPKETHSEVGDLMKALKFLDAKNTTFSMSVSFTLPAKQASGTFDANIVAVDQSKADYLCLDVKYSYAALEALAIEPPKPTCWHEEDATDHKCFEACAPNEFITKGYSEQGTCPAKYSTKDTGKVVTQCADGVTNLRWCPKPLIVNVTFTTKGEAGAPVELLTATPTCWHEEDATDHKCFEACAASTFKTKGYSETGACPAKYSTKDTGKVVTQCADGVTNLRWCPAGQVVNVTFTTKGEAAVVTFLDTLVGGVAHCKSNSDCPSSYCQNGVCHACGDECCLTDKDCPGSYCANDPTKMPPYSCHGPSTLAEAAATPTCWHEEDATDHKCFEACAASTFKTKGYSETGACPAKYSTKDTGKVVTQCADGVTNLRWCPASQVVNVTFTTKGEAGALDTLVSETLDTSVYCMKDPSKKPPYYCHVPPLPAKCTKDSDCVSPWYSSYCVNKFQCKEELPPTCTTDKDCQR